MNIRVTITYNKLQHDMKLHHSFNNFFSHHLCYILIGKSKKKKIVDLHLSTQQGLIFLPFEGARPSMKSIVTSSKLDKELKMTVKVLLVTKSHFQFISTLHKRQHNSSLLGAWMPIKLLC